MSAAASLSNGSDASPKAFPTRELVVDVNRTTGAVGMEASNGKHSAAPGSVQEYGRTYQGYDAGAYHLPNDPEEQARLDHQHRMTRLIQHGKLSLAPVQNPKTVVDMCTGTGIWALEYAAENPDAAVIGCDLSEIQSKERVPNCSFKQLDIEKQPWSSFPGPIDYVYFRYVVLCFSNTSSVMAKAYANMAAGGYIEFLDFHLSPRSPDGSINGTAQAEWLNQMVVAGRAIGRDFLKVTNYKQWLEEAGFVDVVEEVIPVPLNDWATDPYQKEVGRFFLYDAYAMYQGTAKLMEMAGMTPEQAKDLTERAIAAAKDPAIHSYTNMHVVYGRKPHPGEVSK